MIHVYPVPGTGCDANSITAEQKHIITAQNRNQPLSTFLRICPRIFWIWVFFCYSACSKWARIILFRQLVFSIIGRYTCGSARVSRGPRCKQANAEQRVCIRTRKPKRHCCRGFLWPRSESISLECQDCMNGILSHLVLPFRIHV